MLHTDLTKAIQADSGLFCCSFPPSVRPPFRGVAAFCACLVLMYACIFPSMACATSLFVLNEDEEAVVWSLHADKVTSLNDSKVMEGEGSVALRQGDDYLKADFVRYFAATNWVLLRGNVEIKLGEDLMEAEEAEFDLGNRIGWLKNGKVFVDGPHMYFSGERVNKHWGDFYSFKNAKITACDGDVPAWSVSAGSATIELDGYSQLWGTSFAIKDTSVSYIPYFVLPMKTSRQTGFLFPEFGYSKRLGAWYSQPFYWAINESSDLTISEQWIERRGMMSGVEYRHQYTPYDKGWWRLDAMWDNRRHRAETSEPRGLDDDGLVRTNPERFWLRGMFDGSLGDPRWKMKMDLDVVSDQNYLREFKQSSAAYYPTRKTLNEHFGRDLQEIDQNRTSEILVSRDWERLGIAFGARFEQNLDVGNGNITSRRNTTLQRLPQFDMFLFKGGLPVQSPAIPIEFEAEGQAVNFFRHNGTSGSRFEIHPSVSVPLVSEYGTIIPKAGWRVTQYNTDKVQQLDTDRGTGRGTQRDIPDFSVAAFTELARTFEVTSEGSFLPTADNVGESRWMAVRHSFQPRIEYSNVPNVNQMDNPYYDVSDRIEPENELRVSLTNVLSRKAATVTMLDGEHASAPALEYSYKDVMRFRLDQAYDFREAERADHLDEYKRRPLSDTEAELMFSPMQYVDVTHRTFWSPYTGSITSHEHLLGFYLDDVGRVDTGLDFRDKIDEYKRQREDRLRIFKTEATLSFFKPWSFRTLYRSDIEKGTDLEKTVELIYTHQCFEIIAQFSRTPDDDSVNLYVKIPGLTF